MEYTKVCFKCEIEQPITEFHKHSQMKDGHLNKCKTCTKIDVSKHRIDNLEYVQEYDRERGRDKTSERTLKIRARAKMPKNLEKSRIVKKKSAGKYPEKMKCRQYLNNAIRDHLTRGIQYVEL